MKKVERCRSITNLFCVICILVLSFLPAINNGKEVYSVLGLVSEMKNNPGFYVNAMGILLLVTIIVYAVYLAILLIGKKTVDGMISNIVIFIGIVFNVAIFMLAFYNVGEELVVPVTVWFILKIVAIAIQFMNIKSGEEFWEIVLKD